MKIYDVSKIYGVYDAQPAAGRPVKKAAVPGKSDKLQLSRDAVDFQAVMKGLKDSPDVRADKVAELKRKYDAGERFADSGTLAETLIKNGVIKKT